jgi:GTP-binding protein HflX
MLNAMTGAGVLAEDKLFATLDPTTRICRLPGGRNILMTDTVGFIDKLPHNLIDAFRSTLEEVRYADILLHVVDISDPGEELHIRTVYETMDELGAGNKPVITVLNKTDRLDEGEKARLLFYRDPKAKYTIPVSARTGEGLEALTGRIEDILREDQVLTELSVPYDKAGYLEELRRKGCIIHEEYRNKDIYVKAYVPKALSGQHQY